MNKPGQKIKVTTVSVRQILRQSRKEAKLGIEMPAPPPTRPVTRSDCMSQLRPCAYVACKYHLYLDITSKGAIKINHAADVSEMWESCALDVAERGGVTLEDISEIISVTRERVRQIESVAVQTLRNVDAADLEDQTK